MGATAEFHCWEITFEKGLPSFADIQSRFESQTGLPIGLIANLQLQTLTTSFTDIISLLEKDYPTFAQLEREKQEFFKKGHFEEAAQFRDKAKGQLNSLNYITEVWLSIPGFGGMELSVDGNQISLTDFSVSMKERYASESLLKVLIDLGGKFDESGDIPEERDIGNWKKLKKWHEYNWLDQPKK